MIASFAAYMRLRFGIAGLSAKKSLSFSAGVLPSSVSALSPRNADPVRIADRRHGGKTVKRTAQHDGEKAWIAPLGECKTGM